MNIDVRYWTDFADGAVMFPLGIAIALSLVLLKQYRVAFAWTAAVGCVWATMLVLKLGGYMVSGLFPDSPLHDIDLITPSGHVASASIVYGGLIGLLLGRRGSLIRRCVVAAAAVAIAIGLTRILIGAHSLAEVIVGAGVGLLGAAGLASTAEVPVDRWAKVPLIAVSALVVYAMHGEHLTWEQSIHRVAMEALQNWKASS